MRARAAVTALAVLALAGLAACESTPRPGATVRAQVLEQPRSRAELSGGDTALHAALGAGVGRAEAERGRLWRAQCVEPDPASHEGLRPRVATLLLPEGSAARAGALVEIGALSGGHANDRYRHGRLVAVLAEAGPAGTAEAAGWRRSFDRLRPLCRPEGVPEGRWRVQLLGAVTAWELDFAQAERMRHGAFDEAEFAAGRAVVVACQLKMVDGGDWNRLRWLARVPAGPAPRVGDVVELRVGAQEFSRDTAPIAEVLGPAPGVARPAGNGVVRCH
jgi:hypothetical protein